MTRRRASRSHTRTLRVLGTQGDAVFGRVIAFVVDHVISVFLATVLAVQAGRLLGSELVVLLGSLVGVLGYFIVLEGLFGQTMGKKLVGVVVVSTDGTKITMTQSVVRNLLRVIDSLFGYALGLVVMASNDKKQRIGDAFAGTMVVKHESAATGLEKETSPQPVK